MPARRQAPYCVYRPESICGRDGTADLCIAANVGTSPSTGRDIRLLVMRPVASARPPEQTPGILWIHSGRLKNVRENAISDRIGC